VLDVRRKVTDGKPINAKQMKRSIITIAAGCALAGLSANANTITIGAVTVVPGAGLTVTSPKE
jgi:hypothetical protein